MHPTRPIEEETSESSLKEAVDRYLAWQRTSGRKHPASAKALRPLAQSLQRWSFQTGPERPVKELTLPELEGYLHWLRGEHDFGDGPRAGVGEQTIKTQFTMIRAFLTWLRDRNYDLHASLFRGGKFAMSAPDVKEEKYDVYRPEELGLLWQATHEVDDKSNQYRNRAILAVLLGSGIRLGELANLDDADFTGDHLFIRESKNRRQRFVPITGVVQEAIRAYLARRRNQAPDPDGREPLFLGEGGVRLSEVGVTKVIQRLKKWADGGLQKPMVAGVHKFRHTYATFTLIKERNLKGGHNIWELKDRMGHKTLAITERYEHVLDPTIRIPSEWDRFIYVGNGRA